MMRRLLVCVFLLVGQMAQAQDWLREDSFWGDSRSVDSVEAYQAYLELYPAGRYARLARAHMARLRSHSPGVAPGVGAPTAAQTSGQTSAQTPAPAGARRPVGRTELPAAGTRFRDCAECPEMVVLPGGTFTMGSSEAERKLASLRADSFPQFDTEQPQHGVNLAPFAIGIHAVTRAEFAAFVRTTQYRTEAEVAQNCTVWLENRYQSADKNWLNPALTQGDDHPVVCVSWNDARAYTQWLTQTTGKNYRLPSEAEREYAARGRQSTHFWWGDRIESDQANFNGDIAYVSSARSTFRRNTVAVSSFKPNPFGLMGVHGNVYEWVEDCWHHDYQFAPADGSAWVANCDGNHRVRRGGSWVSNPVYLRSAFRDHRPAATRESGTGLRVVLGP